MSVSSKIIERVDFKKVWNLYWDNIPKPADAINFVKLADEKSYYQYGKLILPLLLLSGTKMVWMGELIEELQNPQGFGNILILRYRSHRYFLRMVLNPYYFLINYWRIKGTKRLELSWTSPKFPISNRIVETQLLMVRFSNSLDLSHLAAMAKDSGLVLCYESQLTSHIDVLKVAFPNDPNPISFPNTALFKVNDRSNSDLFLKMLPASGISVSSWKQKEFEKISLFFRIFRRMF